MRARSTTLAALAAGTLLLGACSSDDTASDGGSDTEDTTSGDAASCDIANPPTVEDGTLTIATGEPAFEPWASDDDPTNGKGFEVALAYDIADQLGFAAEDVTWVRTGFDEAVAPGEKDYDFNIQQYSITPERDEVVDFSDGYYQVEQAIIARADSPLADATSVADLKDAKLGAAIGTTSLDYIDEVIEPTTEAAVFDDNAAAKAAFDANQVDGIVFDLPTAYYITSVEIPDSTIVGVLPLAEEPEELGILFADGSPLVPCVNEAIGTLEADGTLDALQEEWLNQGGDIPTLTD